MGILLFLLFFLVDCDKAFYHYHYYECPGNVEIDSIVYQIYKDTTITIVKGCDTYRHHIHIKNCTEVELVLPTRWKEDETFRVIGNYPLRCKLVQNGEVIVAWDQLNSLSGVKVFANFRDPLLLIVCDTDYVIHQQTVQWVPSYPPPPL